MCRLLILSTPRKKYFKEVFGIVSSYICLYGCDWALDLHDDKRKGKYRAVVLLLGCTTEPSTKFFGKYNRHFLPISVTSNSHFNPRTFHATYSLF